MRHHYLKFLLDVDLSTRSPSSHESPIKKFIFLSVKFEVSFNTSRCPDN